MLWCVLSVYQLAGRCFTSVDHADVCRCMHITVDTGRSHAPTCSASALLQEATANDCAGDPETRKAAAALLHDTKLTVLVNTVLVNTDVKVRQ